MCKFPGCQRSAAPASGAPGRPAEYCDDPAHTAVRAWRARRATDGPTGSGQPDDLGRPVAMATARASMLREELVKTVEQLREQLTRTVEALRTVSDPDAAAAQVETVTVEADQRVAEAEVARNRARGTAREASTAAEQANAAAAELDDQLHQARTPRPAPNTPPSRPGRRWPPPRPPHTTSPSSSTRSASSGTTHTHAPGNWTSSWTR